MFPTLCNRNLALILLAGALGPAIRGQAPAPHPSAAQDYAANVRAALDPRQPAPSKPGALTLQQAVDVAKAKNPTLLAADRNLSAVRAQEQQAAVRANPYFGVNGTNLTLPVDGSEGNPPAYAFQASRLFERGDKRHLRIDFAKATTAQTQAQLQDTIRTTLLNVKTAFSQMLIAKQALELSTATLKDFRHEVEIANDRYKAGDLGKLDYLRLDLQLGNFESDESAQTVSLRQASDQLQTLMGIDSPREDFDITGDIIPAVVTQTQADLQQQAIVNRPDYAAARLGVNVARSNVKVANSNGTADPTVEAEFDKSGYYNSFGFNVNIPIRIFDKNQGNKETARFQADASRFAEIAARNQVMSDVDQAWVNYVQSKRLSDRFTQHYLDESREVLSIAQFAFEHGGLALIDYLDALRDTRSATADALNAYLQTWLAIHQLSAATATELIP